MLVGQQIGPFAIEKEIGCGAMGTVYRATYTKTGQHVAIKVVAVALSANDKVRARFEREESMLKQLKHPNIVRLLATGKYHGCPFYAMEYVEGETLEQVLQRRGRFTWEEVVELGQQVCAALQHAHAGGIIHRDLKPSNLMITRDGTIKLTDFGIAKDLDRTNLTTAQSTVGTAAYMSPEQCRGERDLTAKSDLYSLGVMFYELLTGRKPFLADNPIDMFLAHTQGSFERPARIVLDIPVWLDTLVCQLLEKKPEHRPLDAKMVATVLDEVREKVESQKSAGADIAGKTARKSKVSEDKHAAEALLAAGKKPKKRSRKQVLMLWFQLVGLGIGLLGVVCVLAYVFWPDSPEERFEKAKALVDRGDAMIDQGQGDDALVKWYDAQRKLEKIAEDGDDPFAAKAKEQLTHMKAGTLYIKGSRPLRSEEKDWKKAKANGFDELLNTYPAGNKFVEKARGELEPLEAPALLEEGREAAAQDDPRKWQTARNNLELLLKRYPKSLHAEKAHSTLEVAVAALEFQENKNLEAAKIRWADLARLPENPDNHAWIVLAKKKLGQ